MDEKKKGITTKRRAPVVTPQPYTPENKSISKEEFLKRRAASKKAKLAADEAYQKSLASSGVSESEASKSEKLALAEDEVSKIKAEIKETTEALEKAPESKKLTKKLEKLQAQLTDAENNVEALEK